MEGLEVTGAPAANAPDRSIAALAALVGATIEAPAGFDASLVIENLETVERAGPRSLTFVGSG